MAAKTTTREEKGREIYRAGKVDYLDTSPKQGGEFVVKGSGGKSYEVYLDIPYGVLECECEDYRRNPGKRCKHIVAALRLRTELMVAEPVALF